MMHVEAKCYKEVDFFLIDLKKSVQEWARIQGCSDSIHFICGSDFKRILNVRDSDNDY